MNVYANRGFGTGMARIVLPASSEEMANFYTALDEMGGKASKTHIVGVSNTALGVSDFLENVDIMQPEDMDKLNELAERLSGMSTDEESKYSGIIFASDVNGIDDLIKLTDSLDEYAWFPEIFSDRTLGEFIVETGILDVPDELEQYIDYPLIGKEYFDKFGGSFSYSGYVVPKANLPEELLTEDHSQEMEVSL